MDSIGYSDTKNAQILSKKHLTDLHWNIIFAGITIIFLGWMMWSIHDRFIPIQEGWYQYYSLLTQKGFLPYKDFYYFTQPIPLLISQIISKFSDGYMLYRYYGMIERIILVLTLYYLISRHFSPIATFISVMTSIFLYQSFYIDVFYTYYQTTLLFFLLALICLHNGNDSRNRIMNDGFAGFFASLAFITKQSNGLFAVFTLIFAIIWSSTRTQLMQRLLSFLSGWIIPATIIFGWLFNKHIAADYLAQVFGGVSSKGSIIDIFLGFWVRNNSLLYLVLFILILFILYLLWRTKVLRLNIDKQIASKQNYFIYLLMITFQIILGIIVVIPFINIVSTITGTLGNYYLLFWLYFPFYILMCAVVFMGFILISRKQLPLSRSLAILVFAAFGWTYSAGLSNQLEFYANLVGTALILAFLFDRVNIKWKHYKNFLISLSCLVIIISVVNKINVNYAWWGWTEYRHQENVTSIIPAFQGFKLSSKTAGIYDRIYLDILSNTSSSDYVYTYPFLLLFNYVTGRLQPTFSPVHYFDVCPDNIATQDAIKLRENPPKMIIFMKIPALAYQFHEERFRNGEPSGQRNIEVAIHEIVTNYKYRTIDVFMSPGWKWPVYVWVKP